VPPPSPERSGTPRLDNAPFLEQVLIQAGFHQVQSERLTLIFEFATALAYTRYIQDVSLPVKALLAGQSTEQQEQVWQAVHDAVQQQYGTPTGSVRLPAEAICAIGVKEMP
jgi:hypothetical protein